VQDDDHYQASQYNGEVIARCKASPRLLWIGLVKRAGFSSVTHTRFSTFGIQAIIRRSVSWTKLKIEGSETKIEAKNDTSYQPPNAVGWNHDVEMANHHETCNMLVQSSHWWIRADAMTIEGPRALLPMTTRFMVQRVVRRIIRWLNIAQVQSRNATATAILKHRYH
jgi:hypothetical protein